MRQMSENKAQKLVLVTGGAGFIGSHLCECLVKNGHKVISLDNYFTGSRNNHVKGVEYREGHTKDINRHVKEDVDVLYHLGEYSRVEVSLAEPDLVWDFNKAGTFGVVEYWRKRKCKLVYAGSSTKFGDGGLGRIQSPYAWSKASNTELIENYSRWYGLPYAVTYFYNVYGPRERSGKYGTVIEIFKQKILKGEVLTVNAPGSQKRNFTHVNDIVEGILLVGEKGDGDEFGLGAKESYSILEIANMFGGKVEMRPEVAGNRMYSELNSYKAEFIEKKKKIKLIDYIREVIK
mgnify:FL=1